MADFYSQVPKDYQRNLEYRVEIRRRAKKDKGFRRAVMQACAEDVLFFFSAICWLHEPRPFFDSNGVELPHILPFIPWEHQEDVILKIRKALGTKDIGFKKSRGEGASWIMDLLALQDLLFKDDVTIGMCSSTEKKTDIPDDRATLLGKLDWEMKMLPTWMVGAEGSDWTRHRSDHKFLNLRNNSMIVGYGAVAGTGRSGRYYWFLLDELGEWPQNNGDEVLASLQQATLSRAYVSTPMGPSGTYYDVMHRPSSMVRVTLDWKDNPTRNRGMYRLHNGRPVALSADNPLPPEYNPVSEEVREKYARLRQNGFVLENKDRSPWYDDECDRSTQGPSFIARELDMDFEGSLVQVFSGDFFAAAEKTIMPPKYTGSLKVMEGMRPEFVPGEKGEMKLWSPLDVRGRPPEREYAIGVDVGSGSSGLYTSNSTAEVFDVATMEQVADVAANWLSPVEWARMVLGLCEFFWEAYLIWETNYGQSFGATILESSYPHVFKRTHYDRNTKRKTKVIGWRTTNDTKQMSFDQFAMAVKRGSLILRDKELLYECSKYIQVDGLPVFSGSHKAATSATGGKSHGDRVIGATLAYQAIKDRPVMDRGPMEMPDEVPASCMFNRFKMTEDQGKKPSKWDRRTNWDLARRG